MHGAGDYLVLPRVRGRAVRAGLIGAQGTPAVGVGGGVIRVSNEVGVLHVGGSRASILRSGHRTPVGGVAHLHGVSHLDVGRLRMDGLARWINRDLHLDGDIGTHPVIPLLRVIRHPTILDDVSRKRIARTQVVPLPRRSRCCKEFEIELHAGLSAIVAVWLRRTPIDERTADRIAMVGADRHSLFRTADPEVRPLLYRAVVERIGVFALACPSDPRVNVYERVHEIVLLLTRDGAEIALHTLVRTLCSRQQRLLPGNIRSHYLVVVPILGVIVIHLILGLKRRDHAQALGRASVTALGEPEARVLLQISLPLCNGSARGVVHHRRAVLAAG